MRKYTHIHYDDDELKRGWRMRKNLDKVYIIHNMRAFAEKDVEELNRKRTGRKVK